MLDYNKPTPPLPHSCMALTERFATCYAQLLQQQGEQEQEGAEKTGELSTESVSSQTQSQGQDQLLQAAAINQLTINEYLPGQGIAPHTGTG